MLSLVEQRRKELLSKESYIKEMAEIWKGRIDERVYQALLTYEVHIDD